MTIDEISKKYGLTPYTLRYYERIGLLPPVDRNSSGNRDYSEEDYWNIGRITVASEQTGLEKAGYCKQQLKSLSKELTREIGKGFSVSNIQYMKRFYLEYQNQQTLSVKLGWSHYCELLNL